MEGIRRAFRTEGAVSYTHLDVYKRQGEKNPGRGVKENLKPCVYKQREHDKGAISYFL